MIPVFGSLNRVHLGNAFKKIKTESGILNE